MIHVHKWEYCGTHTEWIKSIFGKWESVKYKDCVCEKCGKRKKVYI